MSHSFASIMLAGMFKTVVRTRVPCCFVVFPFRDLMSVPKMCYVTLIISTATGQFLIHSAVQSVCIYRCSVALLYIGSFGLVQHKSSCIGYLDLLSTKSVITGLAFGHCEPWLWESASWLFRRS